MSVKGKVNTRSPYPKEVISTAYPVEEATAVCRLYQTHAHLLCFSVEIELKGERARVFLGEGFARAARIFEMLAAGGVTPCTLYDIVADME